MKNQIMQPRVIVCLCGSTKFFAEFTRANFAETMAGRIVLTVGFLPDAKEHGQDVGVTPNQKAELDRLHLAKIDLADEVLILNVGGYIGDSTRREMFHALKTGKTVRWLEPIRGRRLIDEERARQVTEKGYSQEHDDEHRRGQIMQAAEFYAWQGEGMFRPDLWPWTDYPAKNGLTPIRAFMVAGALYIAEANRLARLGATQAQAFVDARNGADKCAACIDELLALDRPARRFDDMISSAREAGATVAEFGQAVMESAAGFATFAEVAEAAKREEAKAPAFCDEPGCLRSYGHDGAHAGAGFPSAPPWQRIGASDSFMAGARVKAPEPGEQYGPRKGDGPTRCEFHKFPGGERCALPAGHAGNHRV